MGNGELLPPVTPGEMLREEFLDPLGISAYRLAKEIDVPQTRIWAILKGKRAITADTDLRLCRFFGLSEGYWLRTQAAHDLEIQRRAIAEQLEHINPYTAACV
ncbi:MAG: addiction module antidote protein, HigA family [Cyanobium sp. PLM2.Bin73]|nr:MAG: addiction module antidote protein, HigA family [Cyanobium sp. PLM2.Bin73]